MFCYLSTILDTYTKQVLAYVLSPSLELDFALETVHILIQKHGVSLERKLWSIATRAATISACVSSRFLKTVACGSLCPAKKTAETMLRKRVSSAI